MIKEGMEIIAFTFWLIDQWATWALYIASIIYLIFHRRKHLFSHYAKVSVIGIIIIFNPLFCGFIVRYFFSYTRYFRVLWLFPIYFVIAISATDYCAYKSRLKMIVCVILICLTGKIDFTHNLSFADNIYKLPQEVIDICDYLKQTEEYMAGQLKISAEPYLSTFIRQYDPNIRLQFGRSSTVYTESVEAEMAYVQISADANEERDLFLLTKALRNDRCCYMVIEEGKLIHDEIYNYGFLYIDTVSGYEIYQDIWHSVMPGSESADNENVVLEIVNGKLIEYMRRADGSLYKTRYVLEEYEGSLNNIVYDKDANLFYAYDNETNTILTIQEYSGIVRLIGQQQMPE